MSSHVQMWELDHREDWVPKSWCFWNMVLEKTLESPLNSKEINQSILKEINTEYSLEGLMLNWSCNTSATWCEEPTHWKRLWSWERLRAGGEGDDRGWESWMAAPTWWTWVWVDSGRWWYTGRPGMLWFMGSQRVDVTERPNWTDGKICLYFVKYYIPSVSYLPIIQ